VSSDDREPPMLAKDLTTPEPIPEAGIARAVELMRSGRLFRYGEERAGELEVAALEREFAAFVGARYAVAMNSCGSTLFVALRCLGVRPGDRVLANAFTLAPVPGAIAHAGAEPVLVDITRDFTIDLEDLERKAAASGARVLLLSHMRGHIADMSAVLGVCARHGIAVVEDCAHTMGATWDGQPTGRFGVAGCFSLQTFKHVNAGEGGLLTTDDDDVAAKAILHSGSYMFYTQNGAAPSPEAFERHELATPNFSLRLSALAAAVARPQLTLLPERARRWNELYRGLEREIGALPHVELPSRHPKEGFVGSSIQFSVVDLPLHGTRAFVEGCADRGVNVKWYGRGEPLGFTSRLDHWRFVRPAQDLPRTRELLDGLCDLRIPLALTVEDCATIGAVLASSMDEASKEWRT
jgi:dTDP-4-amino-4,6-dideoxygalactose transaminase